MPHVESEGHAENQEGRQAHEDGQTGDAIGRYGGCALALGLPPELAVFREHLRAG